MRNTENVFGTLFSIANKLQVFGDSFMETITSKQWFLLACISLVEPEKPTLSRLEPIVGSSRQNIKQLALKLARKGLLEMEADDRDGRAVVLSMTPACKKFLAAREGKDSAMLESLFAGIPNEDLEVTLRTLKRVELNIPQTRH